MGGQVPTNRLLQPWMIQRRLISRIQSSTRFKPHHTIIMSAILVWIVFSSIVPRTIKSSRSVFFADTAVKETLNKTTEESAAVAKLRQYVDLSSREEEDIGDFEQEDVVQGSGGYFRPWQPWLDTAGEVIRAHGGSILYVESEKAYYWYGENKNGPTYKVKGGLTRVDFTGIGCYSSVDLLTWRNRGIALAARSGGDLDKSRVVERPRVLYNKLTDYYVMWVHLDDMHYELASVGVAVSRKPEGPFVFIGRQQVHASESRDFTLFQEVNGSAYVVYSSEDNSALHIGRLKDNYLGVQGPVTRALVGERREAPALFKHKNVYFMITSGCSGWQPNPSRVHSAESVMGPWHPAPGPCDLKDIPCREHTFKSQGTFVLPVHGLDGYMYIFMADMWNEEDLRSSRYVWLPLFVTGGRTGEDGVVITWYDKWRLPQVGDDEDDSWN